MTTEILVNISPQETRVALVEGGSAQEIYIQRANRHGLVGNVYKGVIKRVLPGMQAAFVDIGLDRTAFLHASDMRRPEGLAPDAPLPSVEVLLSEGQTVLVQIVKDPLGSKGARLTTLISLPARYLVMLPFEMHVGVSAKIEDAAERERLKGIMERLAPELAPYWGMIARTAAEGAAEDALAQDMRFLVRLWKAVDESAQTAKPGTMVHGDLPLSMRIMRDLLGTTVERVRVDSESEVEKMRAFARDYLPDVETLVEHHRGAAPIFDLYGVEDEIERAIQRKVDLKSGGHLVIDQTEAMTTIDVNTGAFTGHRNLEETVLKTNLEAAHAIARQLRLRNLGGIIILDFIDMQSDDHRSQVMRALERELYKDKARIQIHPFSPLGLIEMTRKRTRESIGHILTETCPTCGGRGHIKTIETVCHDIAREVQRAARQYEAKSFLVLACPAVVEKLQEQSGGLAELEAQFKRPIRLQAEAYYPQENFDVVPV
ncbi:MAG: ribonuclease G [Stagnimonas sp.]|nr:ribonuclease G [Stagnimonas sp.]